MGTWLGFAALTLSASSAEQAEYCLRQEQIGARSFGACMRELERASDQNTVMMLLVVGIIAAVYFYYKDRSKRDEAEQPY